MTEKNINYGVAHNSHSLYIIKLKGPVQLGKTMPFSSCGETYLHPHLNKAIEHIFKNTDVKVKSLLELNIYGFKYICFNFLFHFLLLKIRSLQSTSLEKHTSTSIYDAGHKLIERSKKFTKFMRSMHEKDYTTVFRRL